MKKSFAESKVEFDKLFWYKILAPIILIFICPFLKWEDNYLVDLIKRNPYKWFHKKWPHIETILSRFDNNISINGDGLDWGIDEVNEFYKHHYELTTDLPEMFKTIKIKACDMQAAFEDNAFSSEDFVNEIKKFIK